MSVSLPPVSPLIGNEPISPELRERILAAKEKLGSRLLILGHHYQRDEVIEFADFRGDSLDLSLRAAKAGDVEYVVFCGVHFMAETADVVTPDSVQVILPDLRAGCSMADMAALDQVEEAWDVLSEATDETIVPITYINSAAAIKAFCGRHNGAVCTSSNAHKVIRWAFEQGKKLMFFPDQHLGRNTCYDLGIPLEEMVVYDPRNPGGLEGGHELDVYEKSRVILWRGHCSVHQNFQASHPDTMRQRYPGINIIVHPECSFEVVQKADFVGSTKQIVQTIADGEPGSKWAVGTEHHLVNRLAQENEDKFVCTLAPFACQCSTMFRIQPKALAERLEELVRGEAKNVISVDDETAKWSMIALERMMEMK